MEALTVALIPWDLESKQKAAKTDNNKAAGAHQTISVSLAKRTTSTKA